MQSRTRTGLLHDQGEDVEPARGLASWPAEGPGQAGEIRGGRVSDDGTIRGLVTGIPDQLRIKDPRTRPVRGIGREHGDDRPDPASIRGLTQVHDRLGGDVRCRSDLAAVAYPQALPVQSPDAPRTVPPRDACAELQFSHRVLVGASRLDLAPDLPEPRAGRARAILVVELRDEPLGIGEQAVRDRWVITRRVRPVSVCHCVLR